MMSTYARFWHYFGLSTSVYGFYKNICFDCWSKILWILWGKRRSYWWCLCVCLHFAYIISRNKLWRRRCLVICAKTFLVATRSHNICTTCVIGVVKPSVPVSPNLSIIVQQLQDYVFSIAMLALFFRLKLMPWKYVLQWDILLGTIIMGIGRWMDNANRRK